MEARQLWRTAGPLVLALSASACAPQGESPDGSAELSPFSENTLIFGRVLQNSTACVVDAVCYLEIEFADTTIIAVYGTGERPPPPCEISVEVSDAAFPIEPGERVSAVVYQCPSEGHYLRRIVRGEG